MEENKSVKRTKLEKLISDEDTKYKMKILPIVVRSLNELRLPIIVAEDKNNEHFLHLSSVLSCCMLKRHKVGKRCSDFNVTIEGVNTLQHYRFRNMSPFVSASDICLLGNLIPKKGCETHRSEYETAKKIWSDIKKIYSEEEGLPKLIPFNFNQDVETDIVIEIDNTRVELLRGLQKEFNIMKSMLYESEMKEDDFKEVINKHSKSFKKTEFELFHMQK